MPWEHPFKLVDLGHNHEEVPVDEEIVDLVVALNDLKWYTHMSCQNNGDDRVWISFYMSNYAVHFMELIAKNSESLRGPVCSATTESYDKSPEETKWVFKDRWWVDSFVQGLREDGELTGDIFIRISIRFPRKHLEEVTRIVVEERDRRLSDVK